MKVDLSQILLYFSNENIVLNSDLRIKILSKSNAKDVLEEKWYSISCGLYNSLLIEKQENTLYL